eukprot:6543831-Pyramimonas_sp.AAC.1
MSARSALVPALRFPRPLGVRWVGKRLQQVLIIVFGGLRYHRKHAAQVKPVLRNDTLSCVRALFVRAKLLGPIFGTPLGSTVVPRPPMGPCPSRRLSLGPLLWSLP